MPPHGIDQIGWPERPGRGRRHGSHLIVREGRAGDYEAIRHVYAEAFRHPRFRPPQDSGVVPLEVLLQGSGIGSALMEALLAAADAADVPLVALLGAPEYYGRFGFRPADELGVIAPEPARGNAFRARLLTAYTASLAGPFRYAPAFLS